MIQKLLASGLIRRYDAYAKIHHIPTRSGVKIRPNTGVHLVSRNRADVGLILSGERHCFSVRSR
jgi:hypothetical protein